MSPSLAWSFPPTVIAGICVASAAYVWAWRRARQAGMPHPPGVGRLAVFAASMLAIVAALISPIDAAADDLFSVHMVQHLLLLDLFPVLFILSLTKGLLRPVTRRLNVVERRAGPLAHPVFALILYMVVVGGWHLPYMYDLALRHYGFHYSEHVCFVIAGTLFWWHLLSPIRTRRAALRGMGSIVYLAVVKFFMGMLGIILAFSTHSIYNWYQGHPHYWGLTARTDQNLGGAIMMVEQSLVLGIAVAYVIMRMLGDSERDAQRRERLDDRDAAWASYRRQLAEHKAKQAQ